MLRPVEARAAVAACCMRVAAVVVVEPDHIHQDTAADAVGTPVEELQDTQHWDWQLEPAPRLRRDLPLKEEVQKPNHRTCRHPKDRPQSVEAPIAVHIRPQIGRLRMAREKKLH